MFDNSQQAAKRTRSNNEPYQFEATAGSTGKQPPENPAYLFSEKLFREESQVHFHKTKQTLDMLDISKRCETYGWRPYQA